MTYLISQGQKEVVEEDDSGRRLVILGRRTRNPTSLRVRKTKNDEEPDAHLHRDPRDLGGP